MDPTLSTLSSPNPASLPMDAAPPLADAARHWQADYERVARAIRYLETHATEQPALEDVAGAMGLSPFHAQRVFRRWAGVSPKRFLQVLTLNHAKQALAESRTVLDAAWDAGLSGPSRLHDLFVRVEAVTPGDFRRAGAGLEIAHGVHATPFGAALIAVTARGLCGLTFLDGGDGAAALAELRAAWPRAELREDARATAPWVGRVFAPAGPERGAGHRAAPLPLLLRGTPFQLQVWQALLRIPPSRLTTYGGLAHALDRPGAGRAVGTALGQNPIAVLIPCHRVIRATGASGGYRWGDTRKRALLAREAAHVEAG